MRRLIVVVTGVACLGAVSLLSTGNLLAQIPVPRGTGRSTHPDAEAYRQIQAQRAMDAQARRMMREAEANARESATLPREKLPKLTEKDRKRIEALLTPDPADVAANKEFLEQPRTGIFRLFPNSNCETKMQIRVDGECANHVPGGSNYSFRPGAGTPDIHFNNGRIIGEGFFSEVILAEVGRLGVDESAKAEQIAFLSSYEPATDFAGARRQHVELTKGIKANGVTYSNTVLPKLDTTYAVRIIAYRNGNNLRRRLPLEAIAPESPVLGFQTVQADNRLDLIVAFRIIRREADGNLTILWKELRRQKSPVITFGRDEQLTDFK